jgi:SAM-dependent methyltransferase
MRAGRWNHNIHYHDIVLRSIPSGCMRALDVGCGAGLLARKLAIYCHDVTAVDPDKDSITRAAAAGGPQDRITFVNDDVMTHPFPDGSFNFIAAVASLHHLPLAPALKRFHDLLKPNGVLVILGLYRLCTPADYVLATIALPASRILRCLRGTPDVDAPLREPGEILREIRIACNSALPGAKFQRHLFFRYSVVWRKP